MSHFAVDKIKKETCSRAFGRCRTWQEALAEVHDFLRGKFLQHGMDVLGTVLQVPGIVPAHVMSDMAQVGRQQVALSRKESLYLNLWKETFPQLKFLHHPSNGLPANGSWVAADPVPVLHADGWSDVGTTASFEVVEERVDTEDL